MNCKHNKCVHIVYENDFCIFHCAKEDWINEDYELDEGFAKWDVYKLDDFWEAFNKLKENKLDKFIFPYFDNINYMKVKKEKIFFQECIFLDNIIINNLVKNGLSFFKCNFKSSKISIKNSMKFFLLKEPNFNESGCSIEFMESSIKLIEIEKIKNKKTILIFRNCILKSFKLLESKLKIFNFDNIKLREKSTLLIENLIVEKFYLEKVAQKSDYIQLNSITILRGLKFFKIEFANTYFNDFDIQKINKNVVIDKTSFYDAKFNSFLWGDIDRIIASRDTFRQLKYVLDEQKNYIEANNFFVMEMKKYKEELQNKSNICTKDKLIFLINDKVSNFGQNWWLSILWFLAISLFFLNIINLCNNFNSNYSFIYVVTLFLTYLGSVKNKLLNLIIIMLIFDLGYSYISNYNSLNQFADFLNLKIEDKFKEYSFLWFIHKLITSFIIYHFIISIRRQTKR